MNLCKERSLRAGMTDAEFWEHVFYPDGGPQAVDGDDEWWLDGHYDEPKFSSRCQTCGALNEACGYDEEGRPWLHATPAGAFYSDGIYGDDD